MNAVFACGGRPAPADQRPTATKEPDLATGPEVIAEPRADSNKSTANLPAGSCESQNWLDETDPGMIGPVRQLWAGGADDLWIAGMDGILAHYDGRGWKRHSISMEGPASGLTGVPGGDVFVSSERQLFRFHRNQWEQLALPDDDMAISDVEVNETGDLFVSMGLSVFRWNGAGWASMDTGDSVVIRGLSKTDQEALFALGYYGPKFEINSYEDEVIPNYGRIYRLDGSGWQTDFGATGVSFDSVTGVANDDLWALCFRPQRSAADPQHSCLAHYDGARWQESPLDLPPGIRLIWSVRRGELYATSEREVLRFDGGRWNTVHQSSVLNPGYTAIGGVPLNGGVLFVANEAGQVERLHSGKWTTIAGPSQPATTVKKDRPCGGKMRSVDDAWMSPKGKVWILQRGHHENVSSGGAKSLVEIYNQQTVRDLQPSPDMAYSAIWGASEEDILFAGPEGTVGRYQNGRWSKMKTGTTQNLSAIHGTSPQNIYVGGNRGGVFRFDGVEWKAVRQDDGRAILAIRAEENGHIRAVAIDSFKEPSHQLLRFNGDLWTEMPMPFPVGFKMDETRFLNGGFGKNELPICAAVWDGRVACWDGVVWKEETVGNSSWIAAIAGNRTGSRVAIDGEGAVFMKKDGNWTRRLTGCPCRDVRKMWNDSKGWDYASCSGGVVVRFDKTRTELVEMPVDVEVFEIQGSGPDDIYAIGNRRQKASDEAEEEWRQEAVALHFDGKEWSVVVSAPNQYFTSIQVVRRDRVFILAQGMSMEISPQHHLWKYDAQQWSSAPIRTERLLNIPLQSVEVDGDSLRVTGPGGVRFRAPCIP